MADIVIIGGTRGIGRELAAFCARRGDDVVITGREAERSEKIAAELTEQVKADSKLDGTGNDTGTGVGTVRGLGLDLTEPAALAAAVGGVEHVDRLVLTAIDRDTNTVRDYNVHRAVALATIKLVGYTEAVHVLAPRMPDDASILLFGGTAKDRPYPGSTTVSSVNAAVVGMVTTLALELAPIRVNALHSGPVGDSPYWQDSPGVLQAAAAGTLTGRLATMRDIVEASVFLLDNPAVNSVNLTVDGGRR